MHFLAQGNYLIGCEFWERFLFNCTLTQRDLAFTLLPTEALHHLSKQIALFIWHLALSVLR